MNACTHHSGLLSYMLPEEWLVCSTTSRQKKKGCPIRNGMGAENQCLHCHESQRCILRLVHKELRRDTLMPYNYRDYLHSQPIHTTYTPSNHHTWVGETKKSLETDFTYKSGKNTFDSPLHWFVSYIDLTFCISNTHMLIRKPQSLATKHGMHIITWVCPPCSSVSQIIISHA